MSTQRPSRRPCQAAGATGLFVGGLGAAGYATRRDLSFLYRGLFFALLGLIGFGLIATSSRSRLRTSSTAWPAW